MIRLTNNEYNISLELIENKVNVLHIENTDDLYNVVNSVWRQSQGDEGDWLLYDGDKELIISKKVECIINPFEISNNDRRLLKILSQDVLKLIQEKYMDQIGRINSAIFSMIEDVVNDYPYSLDYEPQIIISELVKICNIRFNEDYSSLLDKVVDYIKLFHRVAYIDIFIFANIMNYFSEDDLTRLHQEIEYEKVHIVMIELRQQESQNIPAICDNREYITI